MFSGFEVREQNGLLYWNHLIRFGTQVGYNEPALRELSSWYAG